jgi:hypothetical protein
VLYKYHTKPAGQRSPTQAHHRLYILKYISMAVLERRSRLPAVAQLAVAFWLAATSACLCRSVIPDPDLEPGRPCVGRLFCRWPPLPLPSPPPPSVVTPPREFSRSSTPPRVFAL